MIPHPEDRRREAGKRDHRHQMAEHRAAALGGKHAQNGAKDDRGKERGRHQQDRRADALGDQRGDRLVVIERMPEIALCDATEIGAELHIERLVEAKAGAQVGDLFGRGTAHFADQSLTGSPGAMWISVKFKRQQVLSHELAIL